MRDKREKVIQGKVKLNFQTSKGKEKECKSFQFSRFHFPIEGFWLSGDVQFWIIKIIRLLVDVPKVVRPDYVVTIFDTIIPGPDIVDINIISFMYNCNERFRPSSIYSWFLKPLSVLHSRFPTKKS